MFSNLSAISWQSPPIYWQNISGVMPSGILRSIPGGAIGLTTRIRIFGVLNLNPDSVLPVKLIHCNGIRGWLVAILKYLRLSIFN